MDPVILTQRLQNPRDWYGEKVQFPLAQSITMVLLSGLWLWKIPVYMAPRVTRGTFSAPGEAPAPTLVYRLELQICIDDRPGV